MPTRLSLALVASCVVANAAFAQADRIAWLRSNAVALTDNGRSFDPS